MAVTLYQRLQWVIDHIHDNLDQPLDLNRLAEIACLSPYHWHRLYFGVYYHDPAITPVDQLRSRACLAGAGLEVLVGTQGLEPVTLPAAQCAKLRYLGSYSELEQPYMWFYGEWLQ